MRALLARLFPRLRRYCFEPWKPWNWTRPAWVQVSTARSEIEWALAGGGRIAERRA